MSLSWRAHGNRGGGTVTFGVYVDGTLVHSTAETAATIEGLACERKYVLAVDAVGTGGRSEPTTIEATTTECPPPGAPQNLAVTVVTVDSISIGWDPPAGDGLTYGVYVNGAATTAVTTAEPQATLNGLACGTQYNLEVQATDVRGRSSGRAGVAATTAACPVLNAHVSTSGSDFAPRWNHLAATFDGSTVRLYLDGVEHASVPAAGAMSPSTGPLRIGGNSIFNEFFNGRIDEIRVYARALSPSEIADDMATPVATRAGFDGLVAAFGFDEASGSTTSDAVSGAPAAELNGATWAAEGKFGSALSFDGANDWVTVADRDSLDLNTGMTLEAWLDPTSSGGGWQTAITKEAGLHDQTYGLWASNDESKVDGHVWFGDVYHEARGGAPLSLNTCAADRPCATFAGAYQAVRAGGTVEVHSGTYPTQTIRGSKPAPGVVIRPADGASVVIEGKPGSLEIYADNLEIRDIRADSFAANADSDGFTARNLDVRWMQINGASNARVIGGDIGPSYNPGGHSPVSYILYGTRADGAIVAPQNVIIDGAYFHDFQRGGPEDHMECLHVAGGDGITIRNSKFVRCDIFSIFFTFRTGSRPPNNIVIENNFFDVSTVDGRYDLCCTYYAVRFTDFGPGVSWNNIAFRYNSSRQAFVVGAGPKSNISYVGNVTPLPPHGCDPSPAVTYAYNVWTEAKCSETDKTAPSGLGFVDAANMDLHLAPDSPAIDAGNPSDFPTADIDGTSRPLGGIPDAGADESR